jgi:hypothetical protein
MGDTVVSLNDDIIFNTATNDYEFPDGSYNCGFTCELWGSWPAQSIYPYFYYTISGGDSPSLATGDGQRGASIGSTYNAVSEGDVLSRTDIGNLVMSGPFIYDLKCQITDPMGSGETINVEYKMHAHAPLEGPSAGTLSAPYEVQLATGLTHDNTQGTQPVQVKFDITTTVTRTTQFNADVSVKLWDIITPKIGLQLTASEAFSTTDGQVSTLNPGYYGWYTISAFVQDFTATATEYAYNGYVGPTLAVGNKPLTSNNNEFVVTFVVSKNPPPGN